MINPNKKLARSPAVQIILKVFYVVVLWNFMKTQISYRIKNLTFLQDMGTKGTLPAVTEFPSTLEELDKTISTFDSVEQLLKSLYPETWRQDLDSIYAQTFIYYRSRAYYLSSKHNKGKILYGDPQCPETCEIFLLQCEQHIYRHVKWTLFKTCTVIY